RATPPPFVSFPDAMRGFDISGAPWDNIVGAALKRRESATRSDGNNRLTAQACEVLPDFPHYPWAVKQLIGRMLGFAFPPTFGCCARYLLPTRLAQSCGPSLSALKAAKASQLHGGRVLSAQFRGRLGLRQCAGRQIHDQPSKPIREVSPGLFSGHASKITHRKAGSLRTGAGWPP